MLKRVYLLAAVFIFIALNAQWTASLAVSNTPYGNSYLTPYGTKSFISDSTGASHLVYYNNGNDAYFGIYYKRYNGVSWEGKQRLDDAAPGGDVAGYYAISWMPGISVEPAGNKMVVWEDYRTGDFELFAKYYNGSLWSSQMQITSSGAYSWFPKLQYRNGKHHLFYLDDSTGYFSIYYTYYDSAWAVPVDITDSTEHVVSHSFYVMADNTISLAYTIIEDGYYALYNRRYNGAWTDPVSVYKPTGDVSSPFVISDDSREFIIFTANVNGISQLYITSYSGISWSVPEQISDNNSNIYSPQAVIKGDTVHIVCISDYFVNGAVQHYKYSVSNKDVSVTTAAYRSGGISSVPNITKDYNSRIHMVFVCDDGTMDPASALYPQTIYHCYYVDGSFSKSDNVPYSISYEPGRLTLSPYEGIDAFTLIDKTGRTVFTSGPLYTETELGKYLKRNDIYFIKILSGGRQYSEKILWLE